MEHKPYDLQSLFHLSEAWIRLFGGGNRSGKTMGGAYDVSTFCLGIHPVRNIKMKRNPPVKFRIVGHDVKAVWRYILPKLYYFMPKCEIIKKPNTMDAMMILRNGSLLEFLTNEMDILAHGGQDLDGVWFDEEPSQKIFDANMMRLVDRDGFVIMSMTPECDETKSQISWTFDEIYEKAEKRYEKNQDTGELIIENRKGMIDSLDIDGFGDKDLTIEAFNASSYDNPHIQNKVLKKLEKKYSAREKQSRIYGKYVQTQAKIYWAFVNNVWPDGNLIKPYNEWEAGDPYDLSLKDAYGQNPYKDWLFIEIIDPHRVKPWGILHGWRDPHGRLYFTKERLSPEDDRQTIDQYSVIIKDMREGREPDISLIDPSSKTFDPASGSSLFDELLKRGIFVQEADRDEKDWGWNNVNTMMAFDKDGDSQPDLFVCEDLFILRYQITHLTTQAWKGRAAIEEKGVIREKQREKDNDLTDCMKYCCNYFPKQIDPADVMPDWLIREEEVEDVVINF